MTEKMRDIGLRKEEKEQGNMEGEVECWSEENEGLDGTLKGQRMDGVPIIHPHLILLRMNPKYLTMRHITIII